MKRLRGWLTAPLAAAGMAAGVCSPAVSLADGDPASDILLTQGVFLPYEPNGVSPTLAAALESEVAASDSRGYPIRVAIIASPADLGAWPELFGDPARYAKLLSLELGGPPAPIVLVVMPAGMAGINLGPAATAALSRLPTPASGNAGELAGRAITAVPRLAAAAGHPLVAANVASRRPSAGGVGGLAMAAAVVAGLVICAGAVALRARARRPAPDAHPNAARGL